MSRRSVDAERVASGPADIGSRLRDYALTELMLAIDLLSFWRGPRLHEGIHQARKALRRTRATLRLGAAVLGAEGRRLDRQLRRENRGLAPLRDAHALVEALDRLAEADPEAPPDLLGRARRAAARARAEQARTGLQADPDFGERLARLAGRLVDLSALPWPAIGESEVATALGVSAAAAGAAGKRAGKSTASDADWHRWRRCKRRLIQQYRALGHAGEADELVRRRNRKLAELLGKAQDYVLLIDRCERHSPFAAADRPALRGLAEVQLARLRKRLVKLAGRPSPPAD